MPWWGYVATGMTLIVCVTVADSRKHSREHPLLRRPESSNHSSGRAPEPHDLAEWVCATIDFLVLDERPASLEEYVSKPTLGRKAKDKVRELQRMAER